MKKFAIIVAGGKGLRMGSDIPKQFLPLAGKPVLMHTIEAFSNIGEIDIILVLPSSQISYWLNLCNEYNFALQHQIVEGGETRFQSVKNGLGAIPNSVKNGLVAIHDGVRPLISGKIIQDSFQVASKNGNALTAVQLKDSIRFLENHTSKSLDRSQYVLVQTPQTFDVNLIKKSYEVASNPEQFTDDASVAEWAGFPIHLIEGDYRNIKITTSEDLIIAEAIFNSLK
ncbi:MAG: 2-C-methyl-D-erythritol 4-phosphate cytidylyltransferase [Bacteroidia bacterium]|nr:2-C-methyl-D-erythritol 4-phosphate cytidylyltransferase [Bacteroidia bacterium]